MTRISIAITALIALASISLTPAHATTTSIATWKPASMASTGDSITRAFDINWFAVLKDSPQYSWSTGTSTSVNSQYRRLLAIDPPISGHGYNDAKTGAKMVDLDGQLAQAAGQHVDYVTVLMGANDVCTSSVATMTPTQTFHDEFLTALTDFFNADPTAHVYLSSLPNIYQLWNVLHTNSSARNAWANFHICQSMLSASDTVQDRQAVVTQEVADNTQLMNVCAAFSNCRWDGGAGYNFSFPASDISNVDYFHPNVAGQNAIAALTWKASYWGS